MFARQLSNRRGVSLLECIAALVIMCFMSLLFTRIVTMAWKSEKRIETRLSTVLSNANNVPIPTPTPALGLPIALPVTAYKFYLPTTSECKKADSTYYVKRTAQRVITIYRNSDCTSALGTLDATSNGGFFNDAANTFWQVSGGDVATPNNLRVLIMNVQAQ